jgi:vesicle coat complex subunit
VTSPLARLSIFFLLILAGCGEKIQPLAGGKPFDYWFQAAEQKDPKVRAQAIAKLGNIGPNERVHSVLLTATKDRDPRVRRQAILSLMKLPDLASKLLPVIRELNAHDTDAQVRQYAASAIEKLSAP